MLKINPRAFSSQPLVATANFYPERHAHPEGKWNMTMGDTIEYMVQYRTDPEGYKDLLPENWIPTDPIVTVLYTYLENSDVVEGGEYALSTVCLNGRWEGQKHQEDGLYCLVMPENNNYCVHMGRDSSGTPKILCDIAKPYEECDGTTVCDTRSWTYSGGKSEWRTFYKVKFGPMEKCDAAGVQKWQDILNAARIHTKKLIPSCEGGLDLNLESSYGFYREFKECWEGKEAQFILGDIDYSLLIERRCVEQFKKLPVLEVLHTACWRSRNGGAPNYYLK